MYWKILLESLWEQGHSSNPMPPPTLWDLYQSAAAQPQRLACNSAAWCSLPQSRSLGSHPHILPSTMSLSCVQQYPYLAFHYCSFIAPYDRVHVERACYHSIFGKVFPPPHLTSLQHHLSAATTMSEVPNKESAQLSSSLTRQLSQTQSTWKKSGSSKHLVSTRSETGDPGLWISIRLLQRSWGASHAHKNTL